MCGVSHAQDLTPAAAVTGGADVEPSGGGLVTVVAMAVMTMATYGYTMVAARLVGPTQYGEFSAIVNVLFVMSVVALGLQTATARLVSLRPDRVAQIERTALALSRRVSAVLCGVLLLLTPVLQQALRLSSWQLALLVALSVYPLTLVGGQIGVLQGERRWRDLAWVYTATGVPRLVVGTALLVWQPTTTMAVAGLFVGLWAPVLLGWLVLRGGRSHAPAAEEPDGAAHDGVAPSFSMWRESMLNVQALLAFLALSSIDVVVARHALGAHDSGLYAAGLILTRAVFVIPQVLVVVAFPDFAHPRARARALRRALVLVAGLGGVLTLATAALPELALFFAGGSEFGEILDQLWLFVVLGTVLSMVQLLVYAGLAQRDNVVLLVWAALCVLVGLGLTAYDVPGLLQIALAVDLALLVVLGGTVWWRAHLTAVPEPARS